LYNVILKLPFKMTYYFVHRLLAFIQNERYFIIGAFFYYYYNIIIIVIIVFENLSWRICNTHDRNHCILILQSYKYIINTFILHIFACETTIVLNQQSNLRLKQKLYLSRFQITCNIIMYMHIKNVIFSYF